MHEYKVKLRKLIDGDTIDVDIDFGFKHWLIDETVRLMGIDTPESRTSNRKEKILGLRSKEFLKDYCKRNKGNLILKTSKEGKGKFGRILGYLSSDGDSHQMFVRKVDEGETVDFGGSVNGELIHEGHARPYFGGSKAEFGEWTKEEGCDCGGKWTRKSQQDKCTGTWYRWTRDGYVPFPDLYY